MDATVQVQSVSEPYVHEFRSLENNVGWSKAELLARWRRETKASDEEIAKAIGDINSQAVNKMRRVWEDFSSVRTQYRNLSFTHFTEALAWDDAEEWLKKANFERMTVHQMREQRSENLALTREKPKPPAARKPDPEPEPEEELDDIDDSQAPEEEDAGEVQASVGQNKPAVEKPKPKTTDAKGQNIPVHLRDIFETSRLLEKMESDLTSVAEEISSTANEIGDGNPVIGNRLTVIQNHIENAKREIRFSSPYVVCPQCKGAGCNWCRMKGWLDKDTWKNVKE